MDTKKNNIRTNPIGYLTENKVDTNNCLVRSSRLYCDKKPGNWWFNFDLSDLDSYRYLLFCGALGTANKKFSLLRVPTKYLRKNIRKVDVGNKGSIHLYISKGSYIDLRTQHKLNFGQFVEN